MELVMITLSVDVGCRRGRCRAGRLNNRRGKVTTVQPEVRVHAPSGLNSNSCLALAELGPDAKPLAIKDYLKKRLGIEISPDVISVYKRELQAESQEKAEPKEKATAGEEAEAQPRQSRPAPRDRCPKRRRPATRSPHSPVLPG